MKKIMEKVLIVSILSFVIILISPIIIFWLVRLGIPYLYGKIWSKIRKDPKVSMEIEKIKDESWGKASTLIDFEESFTKLASLLASISNAKEGPIIRDGFVALSDITKDDGWKMLKLTQTLEHRNTIVTLILEFGAYMEGDDLVISALDGDDHVMDFPPIEVSIINKEVNLLRTFAVRSVQDAWFVIAILRNSMEYNELHDQVWVYVKEYDVWIVEYKANKNEYGLRKGYNHSFARHYWVDAKI